MAKTDKKSTGNLVNYIKNSMESLYKNTYLTTNSNKKDLDNIKSDIDASIDNIINGNVNSTGLPNISQLYSRMKIKDGNTEDKVMGEVESIFNDKSMTDAIMADFTSNKYIRDFDAEVDLICKYMPTLEDALEAKKDNVLSADHFSKDFINVINTSNVEQDTTFNERITDIKKRYNLIEVFEDAYDNTTKYGEQFLYVVPYSKALSRMLAAKANTITPYVTHESACLVEDGIIQESYSFADIIQEMATDTTNPAPESADDDFSGNFNIVLNATGVIESAVRDHGNAIRIMNENVKDESDDRIVPNDVSFEGLKGKDSAKDGFIDINDKSIKGNKVTVPGSILKKLKRENVIPIYIDDACLGYYFIEYDFDEVFQGASSSINDPMMSLKNGKFSLQNDARKDNMMKHLSGKLSTMIDAKFVNANQDLRKEIYLILKHNDLFNTKEVNQMKVTFIPPEDMVHMYFRKDPKTNRGISDLDKALLPAKLYTSLYVTGYLGIMTRGHDKRVYYVKQNIDTNISKVLLNTINQIKKGNFGMRELTSSKNIFDITGRYNDYIIPVGASGDSPINFEVMQGQDIDIKTELLEVFEQMAINSTDVPYEYIQSRKNVDYAVRLTMSNGKFLRKVFKRQAKCEISFSHVITKIYNSEHAQNDNLEVELPPPGFLSLLNTNNMVQNVNENVASILEMEMSEEEDEVVKAIYSKMLKRHYLGGFLDLKSIDTIKKQAYMQAKIQKAKNEEQ